MAAHKRGFLLLLFIFGSWTYASLPAKCPITVGKSQYLITNWNWKVVVNETVYHINLCTQSHDGCGQHSSVSVCSTSVDDSPNSRENLGSLNGRTCKPTTGVAGFRIEYTGEKCTGRGAGSKTWNTTIVMKCGRFLGAPQFVEESVGDKYCMAVFEFETKEACNHPDSLPELPCSLYGHDNKLRDLTPLIKFKGGHEVASSIPEFDFHINVCRGITAETNGHTKSCRQNSSMCRVQKNLQSADDIGNINSATQLQLSSTNPDYIILIYNTTKKVSGCTDYPVTIITFQCTRELAGRGPVLTAARNCKFEVLWETVFACPQESVFSTHSCVLKNNFVHFNLTKLTASKLDNYQVHYNVTERSGKKTSYIIYMNVCKPLGYPCGKRGSNSTACQEKQDAVMRWSLGDISKQTLRYANGELTLTYEHGEPCSSGLGRTTIIMFKCDPHVDKGQPVYDHEDYCFYYFNWKTRYACPPSRRTGTECRVESSAGLRYDLSELVRMDNTPNWLALDGETSNSDRKILINVCGQLTAQNETLGCETGAAICMFVKSTGSVVSLGRYTSPPTLNQDGSIKLRYTEGSECKRDNLGKSIKTNSTITFVCQPGDLESPPVLVTHSQDNCLYEFMWKSAAACSLGVNRGDQCKVEDSDAGYVFDLSPLAKHTWDNGNDFYSLVNHSQYTFELKVCGGTNKTSCNSSYVGACQVKRRDPTEFHVIGQPNTMLYYYDGMLNLTYVNGTKCHNGVARTTHITFLCNETAADDGVGAPQYEKENHCVYNFRWFTKYACPAKTTQCVARSGSHQYDLTSLVRTKDNWQADGGGGTFYINVCRSLNLGASVSGCRGTASVCLSKTDGTFVNLGSVTDVPRADGQDVTLTYANGDKCVGQTGKLYQTKITFICKTGLTSSSPKFDGTEDGSCTYKFRWETAAACKIENRVGRNCEVKDPKSDTTFNLLPLKKSLEKGAYKGNLTDNEGQGQFELNICGEVSECRKGVKSTGACLTKSDGQKLVLGAFNKELEYKGEILTLVYKEGDNFPATGEQREVHIKFYCNPHKPFGDPEFTGQEGNKYFFDFQTSLVCSASAVQCLVSGEGNKIYDLTPLGLTSGNWEAVDTRPQDKHLHYFINICRSVNPTPEVMKCPGGSIGACQIDHSAGKGFNLGYVQSNPQIAKNGDLTLQYSGGSECHHQFNRSIRIVFSCSQEMGSPIFMAESPECEYLFTWLTPSACALTREVGDNCTVVDKQYGYKFDLSRLYNKSEDYNVSVSGALGVRILLNACNKLSSKPDVCHDNGGACIISADGKAGEPVAVNSSLIYFNGQINMTYGMPPKTSINFIFECDQDSTGQETGPACEKKKDKFYECRWPTAYACRPLINVQCSIRIDDGRVGEKQFDFLPLSKSTRNWEARLTSPSFDGASYFINVCRTVVLTKDGAASVCPPTAGVCMVKTGKGYNLGSVKHGPQQEGSNIYLIYEDGDDCHNQGKNYSSRIFMQCGKTEGEPIFLKYTQDTCQYEFLWITSTACSDNTNKEVVSDNCRVTNPQTNVQFDITKLRNKNGDYTVRDSKNRIYQLNVCGPLVKPAKACGSKSGVCQVGENTFSAGMANSRLHFADGVLYLNLSGGADCHHVQKKRETIISFVCSSGYGNQDDGKPVFVSENDCTYYITWHTSLVCERQYECAALQKGEHGSTVKYSLGRLMRSDTNWVVTNEGGTDDSFSYYVNLCRPLVPMPGKNCPPGSWACRIKSDLIQDLGRATDPPEVVGKGEVRLVYKSKVVCLEDRSKYMETHFTFVCGFGSLGHPVLEPKEKCAVHIRWLTSAACGVEQKVSDCKVYDNGTGEYYDLNPLSKRSKDFSYYIVGQESDPQHFLLSVCHDLSLNNPGDCKGAAVCMAKKNGDKKEYKGLGLYQYRTMIYYKDEGMLILTYCSEDCLSSKAGIIKSKIVFVCDRNQTSNGKPQLYSSGYNSADFTWRTSLVCPTPEEECSYSDGSKTYDLRLLSSRTRSWYYEHRKDRFWINMCRGIKDGPKGCPETASVCMIRSGRNNVNVIGLTSTQRMTVNDGKLQLTYSGLPPVEGCRAGLNSKVVFYFECGKHVGQPQFEREDWSSCSFIMKWKSSVACQIEREKLEEKNCVVKHPFTGRQIDFSRFVGDTGSSWSITGVDESNNNVSYVIGVCNKLGTSAPSDCQGKDAVCWNGQELDVTSRTFYYEASMFSLEMSTTKNCETKKLPAGSKHVVVINFQCSVGEGVGSPKFDYVSSNCHHFFTWPTSLVCPTDLSRTVTDIPVAHKSLKSGAKKGVGIAFGVVFGVILLIAIAFFLYKPSRRHSLVSCLRWNFKRHILRKEIKYPVYKYQKLDAIDGDEADSLIEEAERSDEDEENDDDDLLPF